MPSAEKHAATGQLPEQALTGKMTRRDFMERALALGLSIPAATALWSDKVEAATPKKGGHFRVGVHDGSVSDSLDPALTSTTYSQLIVSTHRNFLVEYTKDNVAGPELAESWDTSKDARTWAFNLRRGVEFHGGKTLTSQDVVDSLNYHRAPDSESAAKSLLKAVVDIRADGPNKVVIVLESGNADLPYVLTDYHMVIVPSDGEGKVDWKSMQAGTGAYELKAFKPGVGAEFKRNPNYFKPEKANFDSAEIITVADPTARTNALVTDQVDAISEAETKTARRLDQSDDVNLIDVPTGGPVTLPMHVDVPPFDNIDVRLALKYAFPRKLALEVVPQGFGTIGNDHPIGSVIPYWADLEQREFSIERAREHLKRAGLSSLKVDLSTADTPMPGGVDLCILYKEFASKAGIDINVISEPQDGYWSNVWLKKPFILASWEQRPTPDVMFSLAYAADAAWNESHYKGKRFNELLLQARTELDQEKRAEMYREMQLLINTEGGTIVPFFRNRLSAARSRVGYLKQISANGTLDGNRAIERWWFKS